MPAGLTLLLLAVLVLAVLFDYINGFHDTANAIATSVSTRALRPEHAILMSATANFVGALTGTAVAKTIASGLADDAGRRRPSDDRRGGADRGDHLEPDHLAVRHPELVEPRPDRRPARRRRSRRRASRRSRSTGVIDKVLIPLVLSPILGFVIGFALMVVILNVFRRANPRRLNDRFRRLQLVSAAFMAFSHGSNDAQKTMGIMTLALIAAGVLPPDSAIPLWVIVLAATAISLGTAAGGWRIIKTMGQKVVKLDPVHGFAAETTAATIILTASHFGMPVSTTHVISSAIMGVGSSERLSAVRWGVAGNIVIAWILTIPASGLAAAIAYLVISPVL